MITKEELREAWYGAFDLPIYFVHKPAGEDILDIRLQAVADYVKAKVLKEVLNDNTIANIIETEEKK